MRSVLNHSTMINRIPLALELKEKRENRNKLWQNKEQKKEEQPKEQEEERRRLLQEGGLQRGTNDKIQRMKRDLLNISNISIVKQKVQEDRSRLEILEFLNIEDMFSIRDVLSLEISSSMSMHLSKRHEKSVFL